MSDDQVTRQLAASLSGEVTARQLAAAAIESTALADDYSLDFIEGLAKPSSETERARQLDRWLADCAPYGCNPPRSLEHLYLALVLVDESFAVEFRRVRPASNGFETRCREFTDLLSHEQKEEWDRLVAVTPTPGDRIRLQAMAKAVDRREAEFALVVEARSYQQKKFYNPPRDPRLVADERRSYERFYFVVLDAFENKHGPIVEEYWCAGFPAGVVRTDGGSRLHFDGNLPEAAEGITNRCKDVRQRAEEFLSPKEYGYVVSDLYNLLSQWLDHLDQVAESEPNKEIAASELTSYENRVAVIEERVELRMAWRGQRWYVGGTLIGLAALSAILALLSIVTSGDWQRLFEGAIFGAAGAIASVLFRMHRGALRVDASQGKDLVYIAAMVRPLMGALFGAIICVVALSGHFGIDPPKADADRFYFLAVLGFVAGFSERWAPNLLELSSKGIGTETTPAEPGQRTT